jgi:hypothetical protein
MVAISQKSQDHLYDGSDGGGGGGERPLVMSGDFLYEEAAPAGNGLYRKYSAYQHVLDQAASFLARGEPDRAALVLDGVAQRLVMSWFAESGGRVPEAIYLLPRLEEEMSPLAWWLRLALRAPDVGARLVHCRRLLDEIAGSRAL